MPVTAKAQTDAEYRQYPLQPGSFAVNRGARGEYREKKVEQSSKKTAHESAVGEQERLKTGWRSGKFVWHVRSGDEGCEYQRQQPCIAVFHPQKQYRQAYEEEQDGIRFQDLARYGAGESLGVASALQGAKDRRDHEWLRLSRPLHRQGYCVAGSCAEPGAKQQPAPARR